MKPKTVAQLIFERVKAEFALGNKSISKSAVIEWTIEYSEGGKKKRANGDTKSRKLRMLVEANFLGRETINGQTYIVPAKGKPNVVEDAHIPEEGEPIPNYPVSILKDGVRMVRIVRSMEERDQLLKLEGAYPI